MVGWKQICERYGNRCLMCGRAGVPLTWDHVLPKSLGGKGGLYNRQPLCERCNQAKGNRWIDFRVSPPRWQEVGAPREWTPADTERLIRSAMPETGEGSAPAE